VWILAYKVWTFGSDPYYHGWNIAFFLWDCFFYWRTLYIGSFTTATHRRFHAGSVSICIALHCTASTCDAVRRIQCESTLTISSVLSLRLIVWPIQTDHATVSVRNTSAAISSTHLCTSCMRCGLTIRDGVANMCSRWSARAAVAWNDGRASHYYHIMRNK